MLRSEIDDDPLKQQQNQQHQYVIWMYTNDARKAFPTYADVITLSVVEEFNLP